MSKKNKEKNIWNPLLKHKEISLATEYHKTIYIFSFPKDILDRMSTRTNVSTKTI